MAPDLGFAATIQDDNVADLPYLYELTQKMGVELATSAFIMAFSFIRMITIPMTAKEWRMELNT